MNAVTSGVIEPRATRQWLEGLWGRGDGLSQASAAGDSHCPAVGVAGPTQCDS